MKCTREPLCKFSIHLSVRKSRENYRQIYGKSKASFWRNLSTQVFQDNPLLCSLSLQLIFFFKTAVLRKLFEIRFSYKHCNFSHVCLVVKMASKTVTEVYTKTVSYRVSFLGRLLISSFLNVLNGWWLSET